MPVTQERPLHAAEQIKPVAPEAFLAQRFKADYGNALINNLYELQTNDQHPIQVPLEKKLQFFLRWLDEAVRTAMDEKSDWDIKYISQEFVQRMIIDPPGPNDGERAGIESVRKDQQKSLEVWVSYLAQNDAQYPMWFRYYVLRSVIKLAAFSNEKEMFPDRTKKTLQSFPELNAEALAQVFQDLHNRIQKGVIPADEHRAALVKNGGFARLYADSITTLRAIVENLHGKETEHPVNVEWTQYRQGDQVGGERLSASLQGYNTGWCIAGEEVAKRYVKDGNLYVCYSKDREHKHTIPRVVIVTTQQDGITEVRGILPGQNVEPQLLDEVEKMLRSDELREKGADKYFKKLGDMRQLTALEQKTHRDEPLTPDDFRFLFEVDADIQYFGYQIDPRIESLKKQHFSTAHADQFFSSLLQDHDPAIRVKAIILVRRVLVRFKEQLSLLVFDEDAHVRQIVADALSADPVLFKDQLIKLAQDSEASVIWSVAKAMGKEPVPFKDQLIAFASSEDFRLRRIVARAMSANPVLFKDQLIAFAQDKNAQIRQSVSNIPEAHSDTSPTQTS